MARDCELKASDIGGSAYLDVARHINRYISDTTGIPLHMSSNGQTSSVIADLMTLSPFIKSALALYVRLVHGH